MLVDILWPASVVCALAAGIAYRNILETLKRLETGLKQMAQQNKPDKQKAQPKPVSVIIDPTDIEQQVKMEQDEMMRQLNPEMYEDEM